MEQNSILFKLKGWVGGTLANGAHKIALKLQFSKHSNRHRVKSF